MTEASPPIDRLLAPYREFTSSNAANLAVLVAANVSEPAGIGRRWRGRVRDPAVRDAGALAASNC